MSLTSYRAAPPREQVEGYPALTPKNWQVKFYFISNREPTFGLGSQVFLKRFDLVTRFS